MGRLIVVSNRAPSLDGEGDQGGLVVALTQALRASGGLWVGAAPNLVDTPAEHLHHHRLDDFDIAHFDLTEEEQQGYYLGYSNSVLWPIFHGRVDLANIDLSFARTYRLVARRIARLIARIVRPDDRIWVHDYQLIPVAYELRALGIDNVLGFFLHIPVPDVQTFRAIPESKQIAEWFASYDLVGLQTRRDVGNFIELFRRCLRGELLTDGSISAAGRRITVSSFPISIDVGEFETTAAASARRLARPALPRLIGVDRLDYSKGLPQRFKGYQRFLQDYPQYRTKVSLLQIAPPSREYVDAYRQIREELEHLAGQINGEYGDIDWVPLHCIHRTVPREDLAGLFRLSRACLVTSLFDGMNLVAKEYVAAQDRADPGVLILSQFAGASEEMTEALIINPHDPDSIAGAIAKAMAMTLEERVERHDALIRKLRKGDIAHWLATYLRRMRVIETRKRSFGMRHPPEIEGLLSEL